MAVKPTDSGQDQSDKQIEPAEKKAEDNQPGDARDGIGVHNFYRERRGGGRPLREKAGLTCGENDTRRDRAGGEAAYILWFWGRSDREGL